MCSRYLSPLSGGVLAESYWGSVGKESCQDSQQALMPGALGKGHALPSSLPSSDTGPGLNDWVWDSWCPVSPKSKARRRAVWPHPEPR